MTLGSTLSLEELLICGTPCHPWLLKHHHLMVQRCV